MRSRRPRSILGRPARLRDFQRQNALKPARCHRRGTPADGRGRDGCSRRRDRVSAINKGVWESFNASDRELIEAVAAAEYVRSLAESDINNARALRRLRDEGRVKIAKFDPSLVNTIHEISKDVVAEIGSRDELSKKIYASYLQFRNLIADWGEISGRYLSSRSTA
jgi:hypothetical protein